MNETHYVISLLSQLPKVSLDTINRWLGQGIGLENLASNQHGKLWKKLRLNNEAEAKFTVLQTEFPYEEIQEICEKETISSISFFDAGYPALLRQIHDPPPVLYFKGALPSPEQKLVAIVGSRRASDYGKLVTTRMAKQLSSAGAIVVSGLAFGIDAHSHQAAVEVKRPTIAVLGSGVDEASVYPSFHQNLIEQILRHGGCVLSEYLPTTKPRKHFFVARNRIIAGLSQAVVIVECREKSGALITADFAIEQNRSVYAIPGNITSPLSSGTNRLIQQGANLIYSLEELALDLGLTAKTHLTDTNTPLATTETEKLVLQYLREQQSMASVEKITQALSCGAAEVIIALNSLELNSLITKNPAGLFSVD